MGGDKSVVEGLRSVWVKLFYKVLLGEENKNKNMKGASP